MNEHHALPLAQTLCDVTELVLLPIIPEWAREYSRGQSQVNIYSRPTVRVGNGRATHHRLDLVSGEHRITFGVKMVADKMVPEACGSWLSTREILARQYFRGEVSVANLLAHTGCHEFAHYLQTVAGARRRGSVHNAAFYRILDDLHNSGVANLFRQSLRDLARNRGLRLSSKSVALPDTQTSLARFQPGDLVCFGQDSELQGQVIRVNNRTCSIQGTGPCEGMRYRVSPQLLLHQHAD